MLKGVTTWRAAVGRDESHNAKKRGVVAAIPAPLLDFSDKLKDRKLAASWLEALAVEQMRAESLAAHDGRPRSAPGDQARIEAGECGQFRHAWGAVRARLDVLHPDWSARAGEIPAAWRPVEFECATCGRRCSVAFLVERDMARRGIRITSFAESGIVLDLFRRSRVHVGAGDCVEIADVSAFLVEPHANPPTVAPRFVDRGDRFVDRDAARAERLAERLAERDAARAEGERKRREYIAETGRESAEGIEFVAWLVQRGYLEPGRSAAFDRDAWEAEIVRQAALVAAEREPEPNA